MNYDRLMPNCGARAPFGHPDRPTCVLEAGHRCAHGTYGKAPTTITERKRPAAWSNVVRRDESGMVRWRNWRIGEA